MEGLQFIYKEFIYSGITDISLRETWNRAQLLY